MPRRRRRTAIRTNHAPAPAGAYSHAVVFGETIYCAGQVGLDAVTERVPGDIEGQTLLALRNTDAILRAAGASLADVVSMTVFLRRVSDRQAFDAAYRTAMPQPWPARATVGVDLPEPYLVELSAIAVVGAEAGGLADEAPE